MAVPFSTKQAVTFQCARDCHVGAYSFSEGESMKAVSNGTGKFNLYVEWAQGSLGTFSAWEVNQLAGYEAVSE